MDVDLFFSSAVARGNYPKFIEPARTVLLEYMAKVRPAAWPVCQSEAMFDPRLDELLNFIAQASHEMLMEQGYDMEKFQTEVHDFWGQEFTRMGQHIEHVHGMGSQITGFYFVDVPENSSYPSVFDPRPAKRQIDLPEANRENVTYASGQINFMVKPGDIVMFNSWLAHGFTPHQSDLPFRFIHFNIGVGPANIPPCRSVEVI